MTPAARAGAAIAVLDRIIAGAAVEPALLGWARASRYAGSGDRAAVRDLVFDALRRRRSLAALGGAGRSASGPSPQPDGDRPTDGSGRDDGPRNGALPAGEPDRPRLTGRALILGQCRADGLDPATIFGAGPHGPAPLTAMEVAAGRAPDPDEATDLPQWLLADLRAALGAGFDAVAAALRHRAPVWLRVNTLRATPDQALAVLAADGIAARPSPDLATALLVTEGARAIARSRAYTDGLVELQDLSPQRATAMLGDLGGLSAVDFCAGGGGKALALAALGARVTAHDADAARMADLPGRAARAGAAIALARPGGLSGAFDLVVTDVPCSGSGTWRRDPAGKWRLTRDQLQALLTTQAAILAQAAPLVAPGGRLAYMTCSLLEQENGDQIDDFLIRHPFVEAARHRLTPLDASDGFFVSVMTRSH